MVLLVAIAASLLVGFLTGGSLAGVRHVGRIRLLPLLVLALVVQVLIFSPLLGRQELIHDIGPYLHIATILTTLFVMTRNFHIPGMPLIAIGAALNALVIIANGGYMPSPEDALRESGQYEHVHVSAEERRTGDYTLTNSTVANDDTNLRFLGDVIPIPEGIPLANVISIGDIVLALGAGFAIVRVMHMGRREDTGAGSAPERSADAPKAT
jgi:hypothetical protein